MYIFFLNDFSNILFVLVFFMLNITKYFFPIYFCMTDCTVIPRTLYIYNRGIQS